ncbi:MAG TPA: dephospho-CoA kinase [Dehalococcoidia bacterium]|nr:dephospho-CoA kinase [Dehalococcoidia bacterium]
MFKIGLTGAIASGKSEVGRLLAARGAYVVDADHVAHDVYRPGTEGYALLIQAFGPQIVAEDGSIDRKRLSALIFADTALRQRLTAIVWPLTGEAIDNLAREQESAGTRVFVVEAPLLVDAGWQGYFDQIWLIRVSAELARRRLKGRGLSDAEIDARLAASTNSKATEAAANVVIDNDGDLASLERAVDAAWQGLPF